MFARLLDDVAHFLYTPTALGSRCVRARWHHSLHLIPARILERTCDRYDRALGVFDD